MAETRFSTAQRCRVQINDVQHDLALELSLVDEVELYPGFDKNCRALNTPIEPGIKPVCDALNSIQNVHTLWSCEGHPGWKGTPYVTFIANQDVAFRISKLLDSERELGHLHYCWGLTANFRADGSLQYTIRPNDRRLNDDSLHWWSLRLWNRQALKSELNRLAQSLLSFLNGYFDDSACKDEIGANQKA